MLVFVYVFAILCAGSILFVNVNRFETNRRLALVLKLLILAVGAAAIATRLMP
jgi:hypothetical protein